MLPSFEDYLHAKKSKRLIDSLRRYWWSKNPAIWLDEWQKWQHSTTSGSLTGHLSLMIISIQKNTRDRLIPSGDIDDQIILQSDWLKALKVIWVFRESKRTLLCTIFWVKKENINELNFWQKKNNLFWKSSWAFSSKREFLRKTYLHQFLIFKTFLLHERFQENSISDLWKKLITDLLT